MNAPLNEDNLGGFHTILLAKSGLLPSNFMSSFDSVLNYMFEHGQNLYFTYGTGAWEESQKTDKQGDFFSQKIKFNIPKMRTNIAEFALNNAFCKVLVFLKTYNDQWVLVGRPKTPLKMTYTASTGEGANGKNEIEFNITGNTFQPSLILPYSYSAITPETPLGDFDSNDFNTFDFLTD